MNTDLTNSDVKLCYFGGSGGFILLHLLLLSDQFHCSFATDKSTTEIIKHQWNVSDPDEWKSTEIWPDNLNTQSAVVNKRKLFLLCNPTIEEISQFTGATVFLYADAQTQVNMALYKRAHWFRRPDDWHWVPFYRKKLQQWRRHYNNIKDVDWPSCTGPNGFRNLPDRIRQEVLADPYTERCLNIASFNAKHPVPSNINYLLRNNKKLPNGDVVLTKVFNFFKRADVSINLSNVISDLNVLSEITGVAVNQKQIDLRNHWISLHPTQLLHDAGINIQDQPSDSLDRLQFD